MKWLKETAWPWVKLHWIKLLLSLSAFLLLFKTSTVVVDALEDADKRSSKESERRKRELASEAITLDLELKDLVETSDNAREGLEEDQGAEVRDLRDNPDELTTRMLQAGKK